MITDPTEAYFKDGLWGWVTNRWRKQPIIWGYSEFLKDDLSGTTDGSGNLDSVGSVVPAGYVYVICAVMVRNMTSGGSNLLCGVHLDGDFFPLRRENGVDRYFPVVLICSVPLGEGGAAEIHVRGAGAGDEISAIALGYKMSISE